MGGSDFFRTRLTHSLEVAQIGKGIALRSESADPDLVEAACLAHDIGHPPFGHKGEEKLNKCMFEACKLGFEANAQNLRVISELEVKSEHFDGLNLTQATIDAILKYKTAYGDSEIIEGAKFYYDEDRELVKWASSERTDQSFECEIMNWADDIAYSVHDLEDGTKAGMITVKMLEGGEFKEQVNKSYDNKRRRRNLDPLDRSDWKYVKEQIKRMTNGETERIRKARRKEVTANLINTFIIESSEVERKAKEWRYKHQLTIPMTQRKRCHLLKDIVWEAIISNERIATHERKAEKIIEALFSEFTNWKIITTKQLYPQDFRERINFAGKDQRKMYRLACDYIAGMTDAYALRVFSRLTEPEFSSIFDIL
jgi:dGTPase